jgi:hypothetical protein
MNLSGQLQWILQVNIACQNNTFSSFLEWKEKQSWHKTVDEVSWGVSLQQNFSGC